MKQVLLSTRAVSDLDDIWLYIATDSAQIADRYLDRVWGVCQKLAGNPKMGRERPELAPRLRSFVVDTHVIFCRERKGGIEVARILSGYRDLEAILDF